MQRALQDVQERLTFRTQASSHPLSPHPHSSQAGG